MNKLVALLLFSLVLCTHGARRDYLWTWFGNHGYFQGSFEITDAEMQPGSTFNSALAQLSLSLVLFDETTTSRLSARVVPSQTRSIDEFSSLARGQNFETGLWIATQVPEPSMVALASVVALFVAKRGPVI